MPLTSSSLHETEYKAQVSTHPILIDKEINRTILKIITHPAAKDKLLVSLG
jgi:hypothetical protein